MDQEYPIEYVTGNGDSYLQGIANLLNKHVYSVPIEKVTYKGDFSDH